MANHYYQSAYTPLRVPKRPKKKLIATFDFETASLGGKELASTYCLLNEQGGIIESGYFTKNIIGGLWEVMQRNPEHEWHAHHAQYDWRYLLPYIDAQRILMQIVMVTNTKILSVECANGVKMFDSFLLYPQSLKKFSAQFAPDHAKLEIDNITNFNPKNKQHIEYAIRDAEALALSLYNYKEAFKSLWGIYPAITAPSSAMKAWRTTLADYINPDKQFENFYRTAYYGGFVAPLDCRVHNNVRTFDINSSYPASMRKGIPAGARFFTYPEYYDDGLPGFWAVEVETPDDLIVPVLPYREGKIPDDIKDFELPKSSAIYPKGKFKTVASTVELDFAASIGYKIKPLYGICFERIEYPFNTFVDRCEKLRAEHKGTGLEQVVKLTQNSLYGKFGSKRIRREVGILPEFPEGWTPLEALPEYGFKEVENEDMLCAPEVAAWITANSRVNLFRAIYSGGASHVLYCDTDSITVTSEFNADLINIGNEYGAFKHEKTYSVYRCHAPKVYAGKVNDIWVGACKGIPKPDSEDFEKIFNGETIEKSYLSLNSLMNYLEKSERAEAELVMRKSTQAENCRAWEITPFERTRLVEINQ